MRRLRMRFSLLLGMALSLTPAHAQQTTLTGHAADLYKKAQKDGHFYKDAKKLSFEVRSTSDGKSFVAIWKPKTEPTRRLVALHGTQGFATDVLALWNPTVKSNNVGFIPLQWWLGDNANSNSRRYCRCAATFSP